MNVKCMIVEDEPIAINIIENHLRNFPEIEVTAKCSNAIKAFEVLQKKKIDLMFLDINMPKLNGLDFLKTLNNPPKVVITTAYREFALDGFELNVVDYLLKPISLERFMKAIDKFYQINLSNTKHEQRSIVNAENNDPFIYVKADRKNLKVHLKEIVYVESMKDYVVIHKSNEKIITKQQISTFDKILPDNLFLRIHRSYIVAISKITAVTKTSIEIGKKELPISRNYKNEVSQVLKVV